MKKWLLFLICFLLFPATTKGANYCTSQASALARAFVSNVNIDYEISVVNNTPNFTITMTNLTDDMLVFDNVTSKTYKQFSKNGSELKITTNKNGQYRFTIYSIKCKENIGEKSVILPIYNAYYSDPLCNGLESYSPCQRWSGYQGSRQKFEADIADLKKQIAANKPLEDVEVDQKKSLYDQAVEIIVNYWWLFVVLFTLVGFVTYLIRKNSKKNEYNFKL